MTTTSSTSASTTAITTSNAGSQITQALGTGLGVDTAALVESLVTAQFASKTQALTTNTAALTAQISEVSKLQSGITSFSSALTSLVRSGTLTTQPSSSNTAALTAATLPGATLPSLSSTVTVSRLASAQAATTAASFGTRTATVGTGNLTLTFGTATVSNGAQTGFAAGSAAPITIAIDSAHQTLEGIASAINAAKSGVTASIITDVDGTARLTIKGATGAANAFTLSGDTPALRAFNVGVGQSATTIGTSAANAALTVDGVAVERASNTVSDLITGVKLSLTGIGTTTLGTTRQIPDLSQAVSNFVETFNQVHAVVAEATDPATGTLKTDSATASLARSLSQLTSLKLTTNGAAGAPSTLAEIGVATKRDGTLTVNASILSAALDQYPDAVEAIFADGVGDSGHGINAALTAITSNATSTTTGLAASTTRYTAAQATITDQQTKLTTDEEATRTRLTAQFAASDAQVASYKSIQSFLTGQIAAWNKSSS
jgi:flagellar hook-associated protein 2